MAKNKKVTIEELEEAYQLVKDLFCNYESAEKQYSEAVENFNKLSNRTSKEVLAKFVRKGDLFS